MKEIRPVTDLNNLSKSFKEVRMNKKITTQSLLQSKYSLTT